MHVQILPPCQELFRFFIMTVLTAHWLACTWGFVGFAGESSVEPLEPNAELDYSHSWIQGARLTEASPTQLYGA